MPVSVFGQLADNCVKFVRKGSLVGVTGRLTQRKFVRKNDNVEVTVTEIVASGVEFLTPKGNESVSGEETIVQPSSDVVADEPATNEDADSIDATQDDLPF